MRIVPLPVSIPIVNIYYQLAAIVALGAVAAAQQDIFPGRAYGVSNAVNLAAGDFNGDGKTDAAVAEVTQLGVVAWMGNGAGQFPSKVASPALATGFIVDLAAGDFDKDGKLDLALADFSAAQIVLAMGNGLGGFTAGAVQAAGTDPSRIVSADVNLDTNLDAIVTNNGSNNVTVALGNGSGGFASASNFATPAAPYYIGVGLLSTDAAPDLAIWCGDDKIRFYLNNGSGSFTVSGQARPAPGGQDVAVGDINNDGKADAVVVGTPAQKTARVFLSGGASFATGVDYVCANPGASGSPIQVAIGDLNNDGRRDLVVGLSANDGGDVRVLLQSATAR
jgi:hypothetical protein